MSIADNLVTIAENVPKVYEAGKLEERNAFWETYQDGGNRVNWQYAFYYSWWTDDTYNPIYPMKVGDANVNMFYRTPVTDTKVPIDVRDTKLNYTFREANIVTIPELIVNESTDLNQAFISCSKLKNITITGTLAKSVTMGACPLTVASFKSLITALKDFTGGSEYSCTLTVKSSAFSKLEAEGSTAEYNGTACTWAELIGFKKWNLVKA